MPTDPIPHPLQSSEGEGLAYLAGKYMTFRLANEEHGIGIRSVREIIGLIPVTRIPSAPESVAGIINLRGEVIPVVDLRRRLGMTPTEATGQTVIIVVQCDDAGQRRVTLGILVDQVLEVLSIEASAIERMPSLTTIRGESDFILGIDKAGQRVIFLLDTSRVLSQADARALAPVRAQA
jgi:purine-binding chemotaxis protein CheW